MLARLAKPRTYESLMGRIFPLEFLALLLASAPLLAPLLAPGYLRGDDAAYTPWRALELLQALKGGVLFPRWSNDLYYGYGFPLFNYYSPLSLYEVVAASGFGLFNLLTASKLVFGIDLLLAGVGASVLARSLGMSRLAGVGAGILYMYSPHTVREVYIRSGLPTIAALAVLPFVLAAFVNLSSRKSVFSIVLGAFSILVAVLTHNLTSAVTLGMTAGMVLVHFWKVRDSKALVMSVFAMLLGLGLSSFFLVPSLADLRLSHTEALAAGDLDFHNYFVDPLGGTNALLASRVANKPNGIPTWGPIDLHIVYPYESMPVKLGLFQGLLIVLSIASALAHRRLNPWLLSMALMGAILYYLHTSWSQWLWENVPVLPPFQYPWRMLGPMGLCIALVGSWSVASVAGRKHKIALALVLIVAVLSARWGLPTELGPLEEGLQLTAQDLIVRDYQDRSHLGTMTYAQFLPLSVQWDKEKLNVGDLLPRYDKYYPPDSWVGKTAFLQPDARGWIVAARSGQQWMEARVQAGEPLLVAFHTVFFPGWAAYVDGRQVPIEPTPWQVDEDGRGFALGICQVPVPAGNHVVRIQFENTPLRFWSSVVSLLSVLIVGVLLFLGMKRASRLKAASILAAGVLPAILLGLLLPLQSRPAWAENPTIVDFIRESDQHTVQIDVPAGDKAEDHVNTQNIVINGESRKVLFMHPPASASKRLWVPSGARLELGFGINPAVWDKTGDGVEFRIEAVKGGRTTTLLSQYIDPKANAADRKWFDYSLDLQQFAGEEVELRLQTLPGASADFDWAGWSDPRVVLP